MNPILIAAIIIFASALLIVLGAYEYRQHAKAVDDSLNGFKDHADKVQASIKSDAAHIAASVKTAHERVAASAAAVTKAAEDIKAAIKQ